MPMATTSLYHCWLDIFTVLVGCFLLQVRWAGLSSVVFPTNASLALCHTFPMPISFGPRIPGLSHKMTPWLTSHKSLNNNASLLRKLRSSVYKKQLLFLSWARGSFLLCSQELARGGGSRIGYVKAFQPWQQHNTDLPTGGQ